MSDSYHRYRLLTAETADELENLVDELLQDGWVPIGGVSVAIGRYTPFGQSYPEDLRIYAQAMGRRIT